MSHLHAFTFQVLRVISGFMAALEMLVVSMALTCLMMGASGIVVPVAGVLAGSLMSIVGFYDLREGLIQERDQEVRNALSVV